MTKEEYSIRKYQEGDLDQLMAIWLAENLNAHEFVAADYWQNNQEYVAEALVKADLYICGDSSEIKGFAGVVDGYLAGIFVAQAYHRQGIGQALLNAVIENYDELVLDVYEKNQQALNFYVKNEFKIIDKKLDETTKAIEVTMKKAKQISKRLTLNGEPF